MSNGQVKGIDEDQWARLGKVPGLRCNPPQIRGEDGSAACLILAHGAGAPMDSDFMESMAQRLAKLGIGVVRFEFPYMAQRRSTGGRRPPNPQAVLLDSWRAVYRQVRPLVAGRLAIGGKSMGGRMASLVADELGAQALVCLGYPFYAAGKPEKPRVEHLALLSTPSLVVQGERDALGNRETVQGYCLSPSIQLCWLQAADHDLKPLKASGHTHEEHLQTAAQRVAEFLCQFSNAEA
ncbi:alpha/beta hydrolase [Pseudomonas capeferrum]|uniref:alpha/beta family hydrolase n=1 Tax=Pseudomonas capeferrum TaxID=1495066 RepID=UPI0015E406C3|nr:alpha/beta family hydrolase [Pseudomonas capeferrum]MBA1200951.1 alpha/beta hydrolase [Pseudomonas capeferrum]